jgi:hypothetical protein
MADNAPSINQERSFQNRQLFSVAGPRKDSGVHPLFALALLLAACGLGWCGGFGSHWLVETKLGWLLELTGNDPSGGRKDLSSHVRRDDLSDALAMDAVVEQIIRVESDGDPQATNKRSSAVGLAQFLNETWLDLIRAHRPDLAKGRSEAETLELRRDPKIAREIAARFTEQNARILKNGNLPVTPGTLYLAHFAGAAGAVAVLRAPDDADVALVMAGADATGRTNRDKIIRANPFLERFTVADLRDWADRKMRSRSPGS